MPYILANQSYSSKSAVTKTAQSYIKLLRNNAIDNTHANFEFFVDLFKFHPNSVHKIGCGVARIHFRPCPRNWNNTTTFIERLDGSETIISYTSCMSPPKTDKAIISEVMRTSVEFYTSAFRSICDAKSCVLCNNVLDLEVDHIYPFSKIRDEFLQQITKGEGLRDCKHLLSIPTTFDRRHDGAKIFQQSDLSFEVEWVEFHNSRAKYQLLCRTCNGKKSNK